MSVSHPIAGRDLFEHPAMKGIKRNSICIFISHDRYEDGETAELPQGWKVRKPIAPARERITFSFRRSRT